MSRILLDGIGHTYVTDAPLEEYALKPLDLEWADGRSYALLGPSGCGKSTMLNIISGIVSPSHGRVLFGDRDVTAERTSQRNIAQVFQVPVIYTSMSVHDNLAFPLVCRGWKRDRIKKKVAEVAELLDLQTVLNRSARVLTADQKQLVSLGRGLVRDDVAALLLDEPLTVVDPQSKFGLRRKLKEIISAFELTVVYVTHDQNEAMSFADEIAVMSNGRIVQRGTPTELFRNPATEFVGFFIGSPAMNFVPAILRGGRVDLGGTLLDMQRPPAGIEGPVTLGVRPEMLSLADDETPNSVAARILRITDHGSERVVDVDSGGNVLKVKLKRGLGIPTGEVRIHLPADAIRLFRDGELLGS